LPISYANTYSHFDPDSNPNRYNNSDCNSISNTHSYAASTPHPAIHAYAATASNSETSPNCGKLDVTFANALRATRSTLDLNAVMGDYNSSRKWGCHVHHGGFVLWRIERSEHLRVFRW